MVRTIIDELFSITQKLSIIMNVAQYLQALVTSMKGSLDTIKSGVAAIAAKLPADGGMTADEVAALKASLQDAVTEAADDAAAVAALQPAAPVTPAPDPAPVTVPDPAPAPASDQTQTGS